MNIEELREYCLSKKGVTEHFPFDEVTLVFKVGDKMFALTNLDGEPTVNLKCDPERAIDLREQHSSIIPGYHMNKTHWNTVIMDGGVSDKLIYELVEHSYNLVFESLPKIKREKIVKG